MKWGYNRIPNEFWTDEKVVSWDLNTKLLAIYILSCPHKISEGIYRLPREYIIADLGMEKDELEKAFDKLLDDEFIKYDEKNKILFIEKALKYNSPDNPNQEKSAVKHLERLPETDLLDEFIISAGKYKESFFKRLVEHFGKPQALIQVQSQNQDQFQVQDSNCTDDKSESHSITERKVKFDEESKPFKTAVMFIDMILDNNPRAKTPKKDPEDKLMIDWCTEIDRLNRLGPAGAKGTENKGYSWKEIWNLINFSQQNEFWKTVIMSPEKLRKKVIMLENQMQRSDNYKEKREIDIIKSIYAEAKKEEEDKCNEKN